MRPRSTGLRAWAAACLGSLLLALAAAPAALAAPGGTGGGQVGNSPPTVPTFSSAGGAAQTRNTSDVLSGTLEDRNSEARLSQVSVLFVSSPAGASPTRFDHAITNAERSASSEPAAFGADGFKVWNSGGNDGVLSFKFQHTWTVNGAYAVRALVQDNAPADESGPAADLAIVVSDGFLVAAHPVLADGTQATGAAWGDWLAAPGASNVTGGNYLMLTNVGSNPAQAVTVDFTDAVFTGADGAATLALDGNVQFACAEAGPLQAPQDVSFGFAAASASGSVSLAFSGLGNVHYCQYRLVAVPDPLLDQAYSAAFTAT